MHLPKDTPMGTFYASVAAGGLGIYSFSVETPRAIYNSYRRLSESSDPLVKTIAVGKLNQLIAPAEVDWAHKLYMSVDGSGLKEAQQAPKPKWIDSGNRLLRGGTFVNCFKLRQGLLQTPARSARGRDTSSRCDLGCTAPGTLHHVLQVCPAVQPWRITRHDKIKDEIKNRAVKAGYTVTSEPRIPTREGLRKPDLVIWNEGEAIVIDVQVCGDGNVGSLDNFHRMKITKYDKPCIRARVQEITGKTPTIEAVTINWRGLPSRATVRLCKKLRMSAADIDLLCVKTLQGGLTVYSNYQGMSGGGDVT